MLTAAKHLAAGRGARTATIFLALAGLAMTALAFMPWVSYHWLNEDCPTCGPNGVYLIDYANRGTDVNALTAFGDGFIIASAGVLIALLALETLRSVRQRAAVFFGLAIAGMTATALAVYDTIYRWTYIEWKEPPPVGTGYPRLIFFETHPTAWLYTEIALGAAISLFALALLTLRLVRRWPGQENGRPANAGKAWA